MMQPLKTLPDAKFLLLGDSHALAIRDAAIGHALPIVGGMLDTGKNLNIAFHRRKESDIVFIDPKVDEIYRNFLLLLGIDRIGAMSIPLLSTIGTNIVYLCNEAFWEGCTLADRPGSHFLSHAALRETIRAMVCGSLQFYRDVTSIGVQTFTVFPPRGMPHSSRTWRSDLYLHIEEIVKQLIEEAGSKTIDHNYLTLDNKGILKAEFRHSNPNDNVHGSAAFGHVIVTEMMARMHGFPESRESNGV